MIATYLIEMLDFDVAFAIEQFAAARYNKKKNLYMKYNFMVNFYIFIL